MARRSAARQLPFELAQPFQLGPKLLNHERDHPRRFMIRMADLLQNRAQRLPLASQLLHNKLAAAPQLLLENAGTREPGKRDPGGKGRMVPLRGPILALECGGRRGVAFLRGLEDDPFGAASWLAALHFAYEAGVGKLIQRIVNL